MECAVTNALNKHQEKLKLQEISFELFLSSIDDELVEIQELIKSIKKKANYDGYDFSDEVKSLIGDLI